MCFFTASAGIDEQIKELSSLQKSVTDQIAEIKERIIALKKKDQDLDSEIANQETIIEQLNNQWEEKKLQEEAAYEDVESKIAELKTEKTFFEEQIQIKKKEIEYIKETDEALFEDIAELLENAKTILKQEKQQAQALEIPIMPNLQSSNNVKNGLGDSSVTIRPLSPRSYSDESSAVFMDENSISGFGDPVEMKRLTTNSQVRSTNRAPVLPIRDFDGGFSQQSTVFMDENNNFETPSTVLNMTSKRRGQANIRSSTYDPTEDDLSESEFDQEERGLLKDPKTPFSSPLTIKNPPRIELKDPYTGIPVQKIYPSPRVKGFYGDLPNHANILNKNQNKLSEPLRKQSARTRSRRSATSTQYEKNEDSFVEMGDPVSDFPSSTYELNQDPVPPRKEKAKEPLQREGSFAKPLTAPPRGPDNDDSSSTETSPWLREDLKKMTDYLQLHPPRAGFSKKDNPKVGDIFSEFNAKSVIIDVKDDLDKSNIFSEDEKKAIIQDIETKITEARTKALANPTFSTKEFNQEITEIKNSVLKKWKKQKKLQTPDMPDMSNLEPFEDAMRRNPVYKSQQSNFPSQLPPSNSTTTYIPMPTLNLEKLSSITQELPRRQIGPLPSGSEELRSLTPTGKITSMNPNPFKAMNQNAIQIPRNPTLKNDTDDNELEEISLDGGASSFSSTNRGIRGKLPKDSA